MYLYLFSLAAILAFHSCTDKQASSDIQVMAYYVAPSENYQPEALPLEKLTHIIYSFTEVIDNEMKFKHKGHSERLHKLVAQKKQHPHLKVMIACGGWGGSGGFSDMAAHPDTLDKFIKSSIQFVMDFQLDGIDIDWEYPGMRGAGNPYRPEDKENFTALMKGLRESLDAYKEGMILTFASAGWDRYYNHIDLPEVMKYVDYMNIMTYDLAGGGSPFTAHHTNLGHISLDDLTGTPLHASLKESGRPYTPRSAEYIVDFCLNQGVNPQQLVIGGAFYGRAWKGVPPENNGLYQSNKGVWIGWAKYANIREKYENRNGFIRYWDKTAKAPYLYNASDSIFISYDDTTSIALKTKYTIEKGLGGIMFWELSLDADENGLVDAIHKEVEP
jgi:chitinase